MSTHKHIDSICCVVLALVLILAVWFMNAEAFGVQAASVELGYETRLFDTSRVHTIDIEMEDWEGFLQTCENEEYELCSVSIDGESYPNVAIRAKGNTSLSSVAAYGNNRYSFKLEFDHYDSALKYHGLDKVSLNNLIQDNTCLKDYLTYQMMDAFGAAAPLCSFVYITVNGEDWGLYLAVEGVEESFLQRNFGSDYGELYKPDSTEMGGGRGNGGQFEPEDLEGFLTSLSASSQEDGDSGETEQKEGFPFGTQEGESPFSFEKGQGGGRGGMAMGSMGSDDVSLIYSDDDPDSYRNIFDNAKTDSTDADQERLIESLKQLNEQQNIEEVVDVDEVIRYFVVHNFVCNFDSYTGSMIHNYYLYEEDGRFSMIPWDYNLAFGGFQSNSDATSLVNYPIDTPVSGGSVESRPMLAWIFSSETYLELYHQYFSEFLDTFFEGGSFAQWIDSIAAQIAPYVEADPTGFCTYAEWEEGIAALKEFCLLRAESIDGQLAGEIPSTSEGQSADPSALVDGSSLSISAMGSMGAGMGMGGHAFSRDGSGEETDAAAFGTLSDSGESGSATSGTERPSFGANGGMMPNGEPPSGGLPPGGEEGEETSGENPPPDIQDVSSSENGELTPSAPTEDGTGDSSETPAAGEGESGRRPQWDMQTSPDGMEEGEIPSFPGGNNAIPSGGEVSGAGQSGWMQWALLGGSGLILATGLFFAFRFKR